MQDFEKLGALYLGRAYDMKAGEIKDDLLLYDSKDLTTHGVCVGMTGSGKTGLCLSLLEEAAIDGIPTIAIDPKGDLGNLLLTFPSLAASDFRPWIDEGEAARKGKTPDAYAKSVAKMWKDGLADWGEDGDRIARFKDSVDIAVYTPGSTAGLPVTVLRSFDAPPPEIVEDGDAMRDRVQAAVSGLLALVGVHGDPIRSREHILLSSILNHAWSNGQSLDLPSLIRQIQAPPFDKVGVFDLESFYGADARFELAMTMNNLLASPGFSTWLEGEPLDIGKMFFTEGGKPRISILSIAHLSDPERMFFVTILLNELLAWARRQPGTSSLRALFYMDEIFGYFPPTANPPSKKPMLTLLKQARAYGLGVLLATQNPVDLDYKGLSNTGTWFIGRLQTERDKLRVLDGLEGASATAGGEFDRGEMEQILAGLGKRVFLMHNVHEEEPEIFHTRWALSYLRGPLTRQQIQKLMAPRKAALPAGPAPAAAKQAVRQVAQAEKAAKKVEAGPPSVPPQIDQFYLGTKEAAGSNNRLLYRPSVVATTKLHYVSAKAKTDTWASRSILIPFPASGRDLDWDDASLTSGGTLDLESEPEPRAEYASLPAVATNAKSYTSWGKELKSHLYQNATLTAYKCAELKQVSEAGENEGEFRGRLAHLAREKRDLEMEKLRSKYGKKLQTIRDRVRRAEHKLEREEAQYKQQKLQTVVSIGSTVLGAVFGRKLRSSRNVGRAATAVGRAGRSSKEREDIARAEEDLIVQQERLQELEQEFEEALTELEDKFTAEDLDLETISIRPRKSDIDIRELGLAWAPWRVSPDGIAEPLFASTDG